MSKPTVEELRNMVVPDAMRAIGATDLDDYYFYLKHQCFPKRDKWRDDGENTRDEPTINTVITVAQDFIEANDHYALVICHVKTFPHGNGFMPRLYWTRLLYIHAERENLTFRWSEKGELFITKPTGENWQSPIVATKNLDHKGNGEAYRMKFHVDAYQTAVDEGRKWLAEKTAQDIKEWEEQEKLQEEWRKKREANEKITASVE